MSKKFKSQASSSRAATGALSGFGGFLSSGQGREPSSLTYVAEPPDLAQISDSQLAIAFKNFLKKDDKTRSKALDEIRDYVSFVRDRNGTLDDGFLDAWVKIYPRASIDLVRKVRQNAHLVQGVIATLVGKRIVRFLPKVIGPWLAGIYDTEKALHRTALESFTSVFSTDEKRSGVWKIYQSSILDFVDDVILQQTPLTLSDERTTKPDDAEAKYARVVGTAVFMLNRIIGNAPREDLEKDHTTIETLLCSKSLWALCYHEDSFVRKSIYTLLRSAASKEPGELDWKLVSAALIGKSLHASQLGSSSDLSETLLRVTFIRPQLWTDDYSGKTSSSKRLIQYIQKGSEGGLALFWTNLCQLLQIIPVQTLSKVDAQSGASDEITLSSASTLTESFQMGLNSRDEPRHNRPAGWKSYVDVAVWLTKLLPEGDRAKFLRERICPMVVQYVKPEQERRQWELPAQSAESICNESLAALALNGYRSELEKLFTELSEGLFDAVKLSAPEQSENFQSSQDAVCAQAERLLPMEAAVLSRVVESSSESQVLNIFKTTNLPLLENCLEVLRNRNGKPYGAAAVVEAMIRKVPLVAQTSQALLGFVQDDAPEILFSPSGDRLISIILSCRSWDGFGSSFEKVVERVAQFEPGASNAHAVQKLLSTLDFQEVDDKSGLHSLVMRALDQACRGSNLHWSIVIAVLQNQTSHGALTDSIFLSIVDALSEQSKVLDTLHGLSQVASSVGGAMRGFQSGSHGSKLTGKLLFLAESPSEEEASLAESLIKTLKNMVVGETTAKSSFEILRHNFDHVNGESLSIESLLVIAEELLHDAKPEDFARLSKEVLPARQTWETALQPFLELPPRLSTSVTSVLGGTVNLVDRKLPDSFKERYENVPRDSDHCSSAFRIASFTTRILSLFDVTAHLDTEQQEILFYNLPLSIQLIEDDLSIENSNGITGMELPEQNEEYMEVVNEGRKVISGWTTSEAISSKIISFWQNKVEGLENVSPAAYRVGEAFAKVIDNVDGSHEIKSTEEITQLCRDTRNANAIWSASWVAVLRSAILANPAGNRLCNELVADSTGLKPEDEKKDGLRKLVLLNLLMPGNEDVAATIPTQRLMFLVKNLLQCLQSQNMPLTVQAEVYQALTYVLPCIQEMYGSHWEECMEILSVVWRETNGGDEALPVLFASFKLFDRLNSVVSNEDSNDDVKDAWAEKKTELCNALASTMRKFDPSTTFHAPRDVTVDLLCRLVNTIPVENLEDVSKFFSLLTTHSRTVQRAAYTVLHRYIPSTQEQVSFDVALSKSTVRLPYELMSLLLEAPNMKSISLSDGGDKVWSDIRSYLLSWKVVFDHFTNASATVQEQYVSSIRESDTLIPLLEFMFDFLQGSNGKLVDASKFDIRTFELDQSESDEKEIQWLLVHLYFLCLSHVAIIVKNWWIDSSNRIKNPVEAWTEKFVAPLVMEDALKGVTEWTSTQDPNEERALTVKISPKTAEIIASIPVDEESPPVSLSISLPAAYPLQPALVVGRSRVLVDERKWKSWLMIIQGVIMFANGNLVDGLLAFRRNVQGALKGQSECAICYSVISTDMQTPNKRCATCKNTFHSVCLFRWFKSSNQSTCPLCRNNFNFV